MIDLKVAVIKAQKANPAPDPIFYLAGGPGASAIDDAPVCPAGPEISDPAP